MSDVRLERSINWHMGWPESDGPFPTQMVETIAHALKTPIRELNVNKIRLLVSQNCALEYSVPVALQFLSSHPLANGGNYPGDLLRTCLNIEAEFWRQNSSIFKRFMDYLSNFRTIDKELNTLIDVFLKLKIEPADQVHGKKKTKGAKP